MHKVDCMNSLDAFESFWGSEKPGQPNLVLAADDAFTGTVAGTDGCNRLAGRWRLDGGVVRFTQMASTMMYCEGVDTWLSQAASAEVRGKTMYVFDRGGNSIGTLACRS